MRTLAFISALLLLILGTASAGGTSCGTCDSLGYQCLSPAHTQLDDCGAPLNASTCPVTSCADYCLAMFSVTGGYCSQSAHTCVCDTASDCDRPLCDRLIDLYTQCIPKNATNTCDGSPVPADACPSTHAPCTQPGCACSAQGVCVCASSTSPTPKSGASATHSSPVKAATVPTVTRITTGSKNFVFGSGAIGGTAAQVGIAVSVIGAVIHAWWNKQHPRDFVHGGA